MQLPANLLNSSLDVASAGAAGASVTNTVKAAPGAGARLRIWAVYWTPNATGMAALNWRAQFTESGGGPELVRAQGGWPGPAMYETLPGGFPLTVNTALQVVQSCSIAGPQFFRVGCLYTIEAA